jgi:hypothetical protein
MRFYLGTHQPQWLNFADVPLFVSRRTLPKRKFPRAKKRWIRDGGGFTELDLFGGWTIEPRPFAEETRLHMREIGNMERAAPQDWMCEPWILGKTGLTIQEHQRRTVNNYVELMTIAPDVPWMPVLQGWGMCDYLRCVEMYQRAGVDLHAQPLVGVGTVCRRQATSEAVEILTALAGLGLRLHGFGFKLTGLENAAPVLASADSMAWSYAARRSPKHPDCIKEGAKHKNCANCWRYASDWYDRVCGVVDANRDRPYQQIMALAA